ncbi:MAG: glycosyltransferase family 2 protein [Planctomycetes bacterium]|nr:glycosyltransferase family 2 protein [Planctomycetota bacterium]
MNSAPSEPQDPREAVEPGRATPIPPGRPRTIVVMPAYNAARTLEATYKRIPPGACDAVVLVDDKSRDETPEVAEKLNLDVIRHRHNRGYGGNQKTCYTRALELGAEIVVMVHPDNQYDPSIIPDLVEPIAAGRAKWVMASRFLGDPLAGGMPRYKFYFNRFLTWMQNLALGVKLSEYHTGYRAFHRDALLAVNFEANSEGFVFDNEIIVQMLLAKMPCEEVPVRTHYATDSSSVGFGTSLVYGFGCLRVTLQYYLHRWGLIRLKRFPQRASS